MKALAKAILALILALPLAAQMPSATLWHFGERAGGMYEGLRALLQTDELVDFAVNCYSVNNASRRYAPLSAELRLRPSSAWALADDRGRCLLQGGELPTAGELRKALDDAGIKSPVAILRDFLKQHPYHLEARIELLHLLRGIAERRTRRVLQVDVESTWELARKQDTEGYYRLFSSAVALHIPPSLVEAKKLEKGQDEQIWGDYSRELRTLFVDGDWRALLHQPSPNFVDVPFEVCSPMMVQDYGQHIKK